MPIDNYPIIRPWLHFDVEGDLYFVEIIRRGKDFGETGERLIRDYHLHSLEQFDEFMPEIRELCDKYGARAYLRLNLRNTEDANIYAQIEMLRDQLTRNQTIRKMLRTGNFNTAIRDKFNKIRSATKVYGSVLGQYSAEPRETVKWVIDIDADKIAPGDPKFDTLEHIADTYAKFIEESCDPKGCVKEVCRIPSRTGLHLVTRSFNVKPFCEMFGKDRNGDSYIKTDGITNLYIADIK